MINSLPLIVGMGGSIAARSTSERVLRHALELCEAEGAHTLCFDGVALDLPMYRHGAARTAQALRLVEALRRADGIIIASPGYHGTVSGLLKNALDYVEDLAADARPYFDGRAVGLISVAAGWQATGTTLATLRSIVHALRGWPTPMAVTVNSVQPVFGGNGAIADTGLADQLGILVRQVLGFARMRTGQEPASSTAAAGVDH